MSTCKECKYFVKSEGIKPGGYINPQPFGQKQPPAKQGSCHLNPPSITGQYVVVNETDWCGYCTQDEPKQPVETEQPSNEQDDQTTE